jgi:hypothetical protein
MESLRQLIPFVLILINILSCRPYAMYSFDLASYCCILVSAWLCCISSTDDCATIFRFFAQFSIDRSHDSIETYGLCKVSNFICVDSSIVY